MWLTAFIAVSLVSTALSFNISGTIPISKLYPDDANNHMNFTTKCIRDLGCFYTGPPWYHPVYRPVTLPPQELHHTEFLLYTRSNKDIPYKLNLIPESLSESPFKDDLPTKVLVHGYAAGPDVFTGIRKELLKYSSYNVILVDWSFDSNGSIPQAVANARVAGAYTAKLLHFIMKQTKLEPENIHLIGHDLGGQLSSYVGERIDNLGRITGLDIAGPYYDNAPREVGLDRSDAIFVDVLQTSAGKNLFEGSGSDGLVGHAVFTINQGNFQPSCSSKGFNLRPTGSFIVTPKRVCSHARSLEYFQSSINTCRYTSYACIAYEAFKDGVCNDTPYTNRMGFHAVKPPYQLNYFVDTTSTAPYCEVK